MDKSFNEFMLQAFREIKQLEQFNFENCRIKLPSNFNCEFLRKELTGYSDAAVVDLIEFGFPVSHNGKTGSGEIPNNHKGATEFPQHLESLLQKEVTHHSVIGPFDGPPFDDWPTFYYPLNSVPKKDSNDRQLILDLSFPHGNSINDGIDKDDYLGLEEKLVLPSIDKRAERV